MIPIRTLPNEPCAPALSKVKFLSPPIGGLFLSQNCPMLTTRRFCAGSRLAEIGNRPPCRKHLCSALGRMRRLIGRTLLFALLAGLLSPLAAASSMPVSHPHCMRKPVPAPVAEMSGCHHHGAAAPQVTEPASADEIRGPNDCCQ